MSKSLILGNPDFKKELPPDVGNRYLDVAEFFYDTIQGENNVGFPATFLRLQHCTLSCTWCDTKEVWRFGNPYTFDELFDMMEQKGVVGRLKNGQHLVLTGGSPLRQQMQLFNFICEFEEKYLFSPYIEIENECTIKPIHALAAKVNCWNNSPKLSSSGNPLASRYKPEVLKRLSSYDNSWFKFVITNSDDWNEIENDFLMPKLIRWDQVVLMPCGANRSELEANRQSVVDMAILHNVRYTTREHIILWDRKTGV